MEGAREGGHGELSLPSVSRAGLGGVTGWRDPRLRAKGSAFAFLSHSGRLCGPGRDTSPSEMSSSSVKQE